VLLSLHVNKYPLNWIELLLWSYFQQSGNTSTLVTSCFKYVLLLFIKLLNTCNCCKLTDRSHGFDLYSVSCWNILQNNLWNFLHADVLTALTTPSSFSHLLFCILHNVQLCETKYEVKSDSCICLASIHHKKHLLRRPGCDRCIINAVFVAVNREILGQTHILQSIYFSQFSCCYPSDCLTDAPHYVGNCRHWLRI
jgi:hypothetical protein